MPRPNARQNAPNSHVKVKARRASYDIVFKTHVVRTALQKPPNNRIKPTCALFPGIEPCQVRRRRLTSPPIGRAPHPRHRHMMWPPGPAKRRPPCHH